LPAIDPSDEEFARSAAQITAHNSAAVTSYRLISAHLVRRNFRPIDVIDRPTIDIGERMERGAAEVNARRQQLRTNVRKISSRARELGINIPLPRNSHLADQVAAGADLIAESRRLREAEKQNRK